MSQPNWITPAGSLGIFPTGTPLNITLIAQPTGNAAGIDYYYLLNGSLPEGTSGDQVYLNRNGQLVGTPKDVPRQTDYTFTVRVVDDLGNISDRTFSLTLLKITGATIITPNGNLFTQFDSVYIDFRLEVNLIASENNYIITISSGELPPGLYLDSTGRIYGYAQPPVDSFNLPTNTTFTFSVQLSSALGLDSKTYSITIKNQQLTNPPNTRKPAILNNAPLGPISITDPYYSYYLNSNTLPTIISGDYFSFKILGNDFDNLSITYNYGVLPDGLVGDPVTGWISGIPNIANNSIADFVFSVQVTKTDNPLIASQIQFYNITVTNGITKDVVWETDSNLGVYDNGTISELFVKATSARELEYTVVDGNLPPNITLSPDGKIIGRFPFEPSRSTSSTDTYVGFTFTVRAYNRQFTIVSSTKTFNLTIQKVNKTPLENIYLKAYPNLEGRQILQSLLTDTSIIPNDYLYRNNDPYFGKATDVKYLHVYGVNSTNISNYLNAITKNHYYRKIVLGEIKTAVARDDDNNVIYEVVYSEIVDDLINNKGVSIPNEIIYPIKISLNEGPYFVSNQDLFSSSSNVYDSYSPGYERQLYPASLTNMRTEFLSKLKHTTNQNLLPKWMVSQQNDGNSLGFIQAWVICYTLPNYSQVIANNIKNNWDNKLNMIDFTIDRYIVDKSATYNYDTNAFIPTWTTLPGATPVPVPLDRYDIPVLFEQETILPKPTTN
jgi:hypothetical protein